MKLRNEEEIRSGYSGMDGFMRIEQGTALEIIHRRHGSIRGTAAVAFNTKDNEWPLTLADGTLKEGQRTFRKGDSIRCGRDDVINYFFI